MSVVSSTSNPRVKAAAALHRRKERDRQGRYLIEGPRFVHDALDAGDAVIEVFGLPDSIGELGTPPDNVMFTPATAEVIGRISDSVTPQGLIAVARQRRCRLADVTDSPLLVVLVGVSDPGNAGAIVRTATAGGASAVVFTRGSVDPWNPKAVRAAAGTTVRMSLVVDVSAGDALEACTKARRRIVALDTSGETSVFDDGVFAPPVTLVFGNESHGLDAIVLDGADVVAAVPRFGPVESLNLAAAAAVTIYAAARVAAEGTGRSVANRRTDA